MNKLSLAKEVINLCESLSKSSSNTIDLIEFKSASELYKVLDKGYEFKDIYYKGQSLYNLLCKKYSSIIKTEVEEYIDKNEDKSHKNIQGRRNEFLTVYYNVAKSGDKSDYFLILWSRGKWDETNPIEVEAKIQLDKNTLSTITNIVDPGTDDKYAKDPDKVILSSNSHKRLNKINNHNELLRYFHF